MRQRLHHIDLYVGHSLCQWRSPQYLQGAGPRLSLSRFRFLLLSLLELDRDRGLLLLPCMVRFGLMCCDCLFTFCWLNPGQYRDMPGSLPPEVQGMLNSGLSSGLPGTGSVRFSFKFIGLVICPGGLSRRFFIQASDLAGSRIYIAFFLWWRTPGNFVNHSNFCDIMKFSFCNGLTRVFHGGRELLCFCLLIKLCGSNCAVRIRTHSITVLKIF